MFHGSSAVVFAGEAAAAQGHPVLTCHDVGMPAPVRSWKKSPAKSMMLAAANVLPIPGPSVVMINGAPTVSMTASASEAERQNDETLETIELEVYDAREMPLANEKFELHLLNGDVEEGQLDAMGIVRVDQVPRGLAFLFFPEIDAPPDDRAMLAIDPSVNDPAASKSLPDGTDVTHTVTSRGESFRDLCLFHGLVNWRAMWLDGTNDGLRAEGEDPNYLYAGEVATIRVPSLPSTRYLHEGIAIPSGARTIVHVTTWPRRYGFSI